MIDPDYYKLNTLIVFLLKTNKIVLLPVKRQISTHRNPKAVLTSVDKLVTILINCNSSSGIP